MTVGISVVVIVSVSEPDGTNAIVYDAVAVAVSANMRPIVEAISPSGKVSLKMQTKEPGVQLYTGQWIPEMKPGLDAIQYSSHSGFCLETQVWPDAIHHMDYPNSVLRPGEVSSQETTYTFTLKS